MDLGWNEKKYLGRNFRFLPIFLTFLHYKKIIKGSIFKQAKYLKNKHMCTFIKCFFKY